MNDLMIDLETLGTKSDAIAVSLGAVLFDPHTGETGAEFYRKLDFQDQIDIGRKPTQGTLEFWFKQNSEAQKVFFEDGTATRQMLNQFNNFLAQNSDVKKLKPWGNGPSFDLTILENLYDSFNIEYPWKFWNVRCLRTFKEYIYDGKDLKREGVYHHALDDCKHQIKIVTNGNQKRKGEDDVRKAQKVGQRKL